MMKSATWPRPSTTCPVRSTRMKNADGVHLLPVPRAAYAPHRHQRLERDPAVRGEPGPGGDPPGIAIIQRESRRLTEMVTELLDFTRMEDGRMTLNVDMTDIRGEFEDTVYMYGSRLRQEGIQLRVLENDGEIPEIPCDPKRMRQVLLNILDNAAKHGGEGKRIDASIRLEGALWSFEFGTTARAFRTMSFPW